MSDNPTVEAVQKIIDRLEKRLDKKFDKMDERFDKNEADVASLSIMTAKNTAVLEEHQRRSLALEEQVKLFKSDVKVTTDDLEVAQKDLADSVEIFVKLPQFMYRFAIWIAAIGAGVGVIYGLVTWIASLH